MSRKLQKAKRKSQDSSLESVKKGDDERRLIRLDKAIKQIDKKKVQENNLENV